MEEVQVIRRRPAYKRWWFWFLMGLATVITIVFVAVVASSIAESSGSSGSSYKMGEAVTVGDVTYTVNSASNTKRIGSEYVGEDTTGNFVIVNLSVKNGSNSELTLVSKMMTYHRDSNTYETNYSGVYLDNGFYVSEKIGAGMSKTIDVVYEIPSSYQSTDYLVVKPSSSSYTSASIYMKR